MLRNKYGKIPFPRLSFDWKVEVWKGYGAVSQGGRLELPERMPLQISGFDRAKLDLQGDESYKLILQGDAMGKGILKKAETMHVPKDSNFDWGRKTLKIVRIKETENPIVIPPEYGRGSFILPKFLSEAERTSIANTAVHISQIGQLKDPSWIEKYGMGAMMLILALVAMILTYNFLNGQTETTKQIAAINKDTVTLCQQYAEQNGRLKQLINMTLEDTYTARALSGNPTAPVETGGGGGSLVPPWIGG
jgi:hypothetical protein